MRAALPLCAALAGCATGPGTGFATLRDLSLDAAFDPGAARDLGDGRFLTDQGYAVRWTALSADVDRLALQELQGGGAAFDPAEPPPGYTLCHGGHCHAEDGRLVDYADVEAELAGDAASFDDVVWVEVGRVDLLDPGAAAPGAIAPSPELPAARLTRVALRGVHVDAAFEASAAPDDPDTWSDAAALDVEITAGFELVVDRHAPERVAVAVGWVPDGTLLDGQDLSAGVDPALLADAFREQGLAVEVR